MYFLKTDCSVCCTQSLRIRICYGDSETLVVMCDECDAVWLHPDLNDEPYFPEENDWSCPDSLGTLVSPKSYWASKQQIQAADWWTYIDE